MLPLKGDYSQVKCTIKGLSYTYWDRFYIQNASIRKSAPLLVVLWQSNLLKISVLLQAYCFLLLLGQTEAEPPNQQGPEPQSPPNLCYRSSFSVIKAPFYNKVMAAVPAVRSLQPASAGAEPPVAKRLAPLSPPPSRATLSATAWTRCRRPR